MYKVGDATPPTREPRMKSLLTLASVFGVFVSATVMAQDPQIERGKYLATAGNCVSCHTKAGGEAMAGGVAFHTPFGVIYSTNITSDTEAGIGSWTQEQFADAMRKGVTPDGTHLYPAFPYPSFTKVSDEDIAALYAYIKTIPPSKAPATENEMGFPFNQRALMGIWKALFFKEGRYQNVAGQSAEWNRGAYLVEGLGHCGACHTPRNFLGAEDSSRNMSGGTYEETVKPGLIRPWSAVNLTSAPDGLKAWSVDDLARYLKTGHGARAGTFGPMNDVIINSTHEMTEADTKAMAVYIKSLPEIQRAPKVELSAADLREGETLYTIHCGTCHLPTGLGATPGSELGPPLVGSAIVQAEDPASLINTILYGAQLPTSLLEQNGWKSMKGFENEVDDAQAAAIATYVRASWGNHGAKVTADQVAKQR